jgi:hypothetical protein
MHSCVLSLFTCSERSLSLSEQSVTPTNHTRSCLTIRVRWRSGALFRMQTGLTWFTKTGLRRGVKRGAGLKSQTPLHLRREAKGDSHATCTHDNSQPSPQAAFNPHGVLATTNSRPYQRRGSNGQHSQATPQSSPAAATATAASALHAGL